MKLTIDFKDAYISPDGELNDVRASYSRSGANGPKLITVGLATARLQEGRREGKSITAPRDYALNEQMAEIVIHLLTGKKPEIPPRERGWISGTIQAFTCESRKKTFLG